MLRVCDGTWPWLDANCIEWQRCTRWRLDGNTGHRFSNECTDQLNGNRPDTKGRIEWSATGRRGRGIKEKSQENNVKKNPRKRNGAERSAHLVICHLMAVVSAGFTFNLTTWHASISFLVFLFYVDELAEKKSWKTHFHHFNFKRFEWMKTDCSRCVQRRLEPFQCQPMAHTHATVVPTK